MMASKIMFASLTKPFQYLGACRSMPYPKNRMAAIAYGQEASSFSKAQDDTNKKRMSTATMLHQTDNAQIKQHNHRMFHTSGKTRGLIHETGGIEPPKPISEDDVRKRVLKAITAWDRFPQDRADKLSLDARFVEDLSFDSLDLVEITMALEEEFEFEIKVEDADQFKTPRDVANFVIDYMGLGDVEF